jgi:alpha-1,6-mannosyltransferase
MVIFKPDGSHGMYSWLQVGFATTCAAVAWYSLHRAPEPPPKQVEDEEVRSVPPDPRGQYPVVSSP